MSAAPFSDERIRRRLWFATVAAECLIVPCTAWIAFNLAGGDFRISAPLLCVSALEANRIWLSAYATRLKFFAKLTAIGALAGVSLLTGEVMSAGMSAILDARLAAVTEARDARDAAREALANERAQIDRLTAEAAAARASLADLAAHPPTLTAVRPQTCAGRKGRGSYDCTPSAAIKGNTSAQASFDTRLKQAQEAVGQAQKRLEAASDTKAAEEAVRLSEARLRAATATNPMARLVSGLTDQALDRVKSIVAVSLGFAIAGTTTLLAFLAHLEPRPYRREGGAFKRAIRAWLVRRKRLRVVERPIFRTRTIYRYLPIDPGTKRPFGVVKGGKP